MAKNTLAICLMFLVASSVIYEAQGTFLLKLYLKRKLFPRRCVDFTPFACKGMLMLMSNLEGGCPATREFKEFFVNFKAYMDFINSASDATKVESEMQTKCAGLAKAMSLLKGGESVKEEETFKLTMFSMGKTLVEQKTKGAMIMTLAEKKELVMAMVRWTRMFATFMKAASEKKGKSIDISAYGLDVDVNSSVEGTEKGSASTESGSQSAGSTSTESGSQSAGSASTESGSQSADSTSTESGSGSSFADTTGAAMGSPSGSPIGSPSGSTSLAGEASVKGSASGSVASETASSGSSGSGSGSIQSGSVTQFSDTTGATMGSPSGSPIGSPSGSTSFAGETSVKGSESGNVASEREETTSGGSASGSTKETTSGGSASDSTKGGSVTQFSDTTGATAGSLAESPTSAGGATAGSLAESPTSAGGAPAGSLAESPTSAGGATSVQGSGDVASKTKESNTETGSSSSSSFATSVKQVESETSKEVTSFITGLEKKYEGEADLKVFFDKLKSSMTPCSKISSTDGKEFLSGMKSAAVKLSEAMIFMRSRFGKSAEMKSSMETCQEQLMKTLKDLEAINSQIITESQGKTVSVTQQTELKQTITKWEKVTTQFVETVASSSSSSTSSSSSSSSSSKESSAAMVKTN